MWLLPFNTPSHASNHLCQMGTESIQNCTCCRADMARCAMFWQFYCKVMAEWPRKYRTKSRSLCMLHPLKLVIICAKYGKNPFRTVRAAKQTQQDAPCFGSFIAKIGLNDLLYMCQGQRLLHTTYHLILVVICAQKGKNPSRTLCAVQRTLQDVTYFNSFIAKSWLCHYVWHTLSC